MLEESAPEARADLRFADALMAELTEADADAPGRPVASLPHILIRTSREIRTVLHGLYRSRMLLEQAAVPRLQRTNARLHEVTQATETAAHEMLDKLDRAAMLIDDIGDYLARGVQPNDPDAMRVFDELRNEAHHLVLCLQFQDIVSQQIAYATHVLQEMESRISQLATHFNSAVFGGQADPLTNPESAAHCDPDASTARPGERQAVADAVFSNRPASPRSAPM